MDWKTSRAGNRYFKDGVHLCTIFPDRRQAGYSVCLSNTSTDEKVFKNGFDDIDDAEAYVERDYENLKLELGD